MLSSKFVVITLVSLISTLCLAGPLEKITELGIFFKMTPPMFIDQSLPLVALGVSLDVDEKPSEHQGLSPLKARSQRTILIYRQPLIDVLRSIQSKYGVVEVDCSLFAQIAAIILNDKSDRNFFLVPMGQMRLGGAAIYFNRTFGYVRPEDHEVATFLQETFLNNKGQWVVDAGNGQFIGLAATGVAMKSSQDWITQTKQDLLSEVERGLSSAEDHSCAQVLGLDLEETGGRNRAWIPGLSKVGFLLADVYAKMGKLDSWIMTDSMDALGSAGSELLSNGKNREYWGKFK